MNSINPYACFNGRCREKVLKLLEEQFWGAIFGTLQDQFGLKWMLNYNV